MPTSDKENKQVVKDWFEQLIPEKTIDIGAGSGTYSKLINDEFRHGKWVAIEAWAPYITEFELTKHYNQIIIGEAQYIDYNKLLGQGCPCKTSLVIMGDMLEHMEKTEAKDLIDEIKKYTTNIIISIPLVHYNQEPLNGNWLETHVDHWDFDEMCEFLGEGLIGSVQGEILGYFLWQKQ